MVFTQQLKSVLVYNQPCLTFGGKKLNKNEQNKTSDVLVFVEAETTLKNAENPKILKSRKT
jgi:hypothetical protein